MTRRSKPLPTTPPPLNSIDWIGRFVISLMQLRPGVDRKFATRLAIDAWPTFSDRSPADAADIVAARDLQA